MEFLSGPNIIENMGEAPTLLLPETEKGDSVLLALLLVPGPDPK